MDIDEYQEITKKPLRIRREAPKKKKTDRNKDPTSNHSESPVAKEAKVIVPSSTKAEQAFRAKQEKKAQERILKKASKTHKQRVEEFNKHLDSLSEHYDIPKVSWTK